MRRSFRAASGSAGRSSAAGRCSRPATKSMPATIHAVCGECEEIIDDVVRDMESGELKGNVRIDARLSRRHQDARAALGPDRPAALRDDVDPVFARLPVRLRVLRHHRHERPQAADQNARADDRRARRAAATPAGIGTRVLRRRQFHRQQEAGEAIPAGADRLARAPPAADRFHHRGLGQPGRRSGVAGPDGGGRLPPRVHRHRDAGAREPARNARSIRTRTATWPR